jgi:FAD/FMN-containing dehydrogenase
VGDGGIVIDLARFKSVRVDPAKRRARAGGGVLWCEYDYETQAFGLASPGGAISTTGIAGLTLGGGYGYLSRRYGMACDNLLSADVVPAAGELVTASAESHPDLFWALRGGGGNFGVVTSLEFQLHPVREPLAGLIVFPFEMSKTVLQRFRDLSLEASDNLTLMAAIIPAPDGGRFVAVVVSDLGKEGEGERAARAFRELGPVLMDTVAPTPYCAMQRQVDVSYPKGQRHYWKSAFLKTLPDEVIDLTVEAASASPSPLNVMMIEVYGGAVARVANDATAFGHREAMYNLGILAIANDPAVDAEQKAWAREAWQKCLPYSTGGAYVNYLSEGEDVHSAYGDARFQRLAAIKAQYDPANLFRFNQNIPPA